MNTTLDGMNETVAKSTKSIGIRNITAHRKKNFGTIQVMHNGSTVLYVEPGNAVAVSEELYNKIKDKKDNFGQIIWEKCDVEECNNNSHRRRTYVDEGTKDQGVDQEAVETIESLIKDNDTFNSGIQIIQMSDSAKTLNYLLTQFSTQPAYHGNKKTELINTVVKRISELKKNNS